MIRIFTAIKDKIQGKVPKGSKRSKDWPKVRKAHLELNPTCAVCGGNKKLQVHHIKPFSMDPTLELEPTNLITLCEGGSKAVLCHLAIGHSGSFKRENTTVVEDAAYLNKKLHPPEP